MSRPRTRRRANGEGSILRRSDGRWVGAITTGFDEQGRQLRKYYSGQRRAAVAEKLAQGQETLGEGGRCFGRS